MSDDDERFMRTRRTATGFIEDLINAVANAEKWRLGAAVGDPMRKI